MTTGPAAAAAVRVWTGLHCSLCGPASFVAARVVGRRLGGGGGSGDGDGDSNNNGGGAVLLDERVVDDDDGGDGVSPPHWSRRLFAHAVPVVTAVGPGADGNAADTDDARRHQVIFAPTPASHTVSEQLLAQGIAASMRYALRNVQPGKPQSS